MTTYFSKRISFALLIAIFSFSVIYADGGYEMGGPIIILPIDIVKPVKPWSPSYVNLTAYTDECGVVVMSNVDMIDDVITAIFTTKACYSSNLFVMLAKRIVRRRKRPRLQRGLTKDLHSRQTNAGPNTFD